MWSSDIFSNNSAFWFGAKSKSCRYCTESPNSFWSQSPSSACTVYEPRRAYVANEHGSLKEDNKILIINNSCEYLKNLQYATELVGILKAWMQLNIKDYHVDGANKILSNSNDRRNCLFQNNHFSNQTSLQLIDWSPVLTFRP